MNVPLHRLHTGLGYYRLFTRQVVGNEWNEVAEEFYILRKTKLSFIGLIMKGEPGLVSGTW